MITVPAHKQTDPDKLPGQVVNPERWPWPSLPAFLDPDINLNDLEQQAEDAWRLRLMYDNLFYNPVDRGV